MYSKKPVSTLIDDSMFMPLEQYNNKETKEKIDNKEQHEKTVRTMLTHMLKEKIKRNK